MELEKDEEEEGDLSLSEATEYVRQQLASMGVKNVSGKELEAYTRDFLQLLKEKEDISSESSAESDSVRTPPNPSSVRTPPNPSPSSAVFKTVLRGGSVGAVTTSLPPTYSPSPTTDCSSLITPDKPVLQVSVRNDGDHFVKRKVLRRVDTRTENSVIDEEVLNDSHLTSASRTSSSCSSRRPKSFIRPVSSMPSYVGRIRKSDPVQRYHEYKEGWKTQQPPGDKPRHGLRWHIREQLITQDTPTIPPPRKTYQSSGYVVPTSKKRQSLRWEIRHQLAHNT